MNNVLSGTGVMRKTSKRDVRSVHHKLADKILELCKFVDASLKRAVLGSNSRKGCRKSQQLQLVAPFKPVAQDTRDSQLQNRRVSILAFCHARDLNRPEP